MTDFLISFVLGIIEGLTEFLPISSTAHLRIVEALFGFNLHDSFWKMYTIVIQLGAILALPVYFWRRILTYLATFPRGEREDRNVLTHPLSLTLIAFLIHAGLSDLQTGELTAAGGIAVMGIALGLLELKAIKVANFLPALVVAPLLAGLLHAFGAL